MGNCNHNQRLCLCLVSVDCVAGFQKEVPFCVGTKKNIQVPRSHIIMCSAASPLVTLSLSDSLPLCWGQSASYKDLFESSLVIAC